MNLTSQVPDRREFTGKERDSESGLDYFGARSAVIGGRARWDSRLGALETSLASKLSATSDSDEQEQLQRNFGLRVFKAFVATWAHWQRRLDLDGTVLPCRLGGRCR